MSDKLLPIIIVDRINEDDPFRPAGTAVGHSRDSYDVAELVKAAEQRMHQHVRSSGGDFVINPKVHMAHDDRGHIDGVAMTCLIGKKVDVEPQEAHSE